MKLHRWSRPRWKSLPDEPVCVVCGLQAISYNFRLPNGRPMGWVIDDGTVWGSHVPIRYARAAFWCKGEPSADADS